MYAKVMTATLKGIEGFPVCVETDLSAGLPAFLLVGLPGTSIREAGDRIHRAIANSSFSFPQKRITVNLSPANRRKEGTQFDLPIALCILAADGQIPPASLESSAFLGEVSLDGHVLPVSGALPLAAGLRKEGVSVIYAPAGNAEEISLLDDITVYGASSLEQVIKHLKGEERMEPWKGKEQRNLAGKEGTPDFRDVRGQEMAKRAMMIAAAGNHAILLSGSPGAGKTMMARCLPGILPPMTKEEMLEVTMVHSVAGEFRDTSGFITERPFREPHHTVPLMALTGGGAYPKPGEISLANKGVLFLDEFPEYDRRLIEALREPMESKKMVITRLQETISYPADFLLVAACNPCPCGYFGDKTKECTCTARQIHQYRAKLSGPILDRIDLQITVERVRYDDIAQASAGKGKSSAEMREEVIRAVEIQKKRYGAGAITRNSQLTVKQIKEYCKMDQKAEKLLQRAFETFHLSARAYGKILKVARTIADLEEREELDASHIAEALQYRMTKE